MNEFYAMGNWVTMSSEFIEGMGAGEGVRERMKRVKLGSLGHYDPIFKYPDIILKKNNYYLSKLKCFTRDLLCIAKLITIQLYPAPAWNFFYFSFLLAVEQNCFWIKVDLFIKVSGVYMWMKNRFYNSQLWVCEIIERVRNLTVIAGLKTPKISFFYFEFFLSLFKNVLAHALEISAIWKYYLG